MPSPRYSEFLIKFWVIWQKLRNLSKTMIFWACHPLKLPSPELATPKNGVQNLLLQNSQESWTQPFLGVESLRFCHFRAWPVLDFGRIWGGKKDGELSIYLHSWQTFKNCIKGCSKLNLNHSCNQTGRNVVNVVNQVDRL